MTNSLVSRFPDNNYKIQRLLLGTHTNDDDRNYVQIATVRLPNDEQVLNGKSTTDDTAMGMILYALCETRLIHVLPIEEDDDPNANGTAPYDAHIKIEQKIVHEGEVNRARYQVDNTDIIATKSRTGEVYIFDRKQYGQTPRVFERFNPTFKLLGHDKEG